MLAFCNVVCAGGAGVGRFPLSREWGEEGMGVFYKGRFFLFPHLLCFPRFVIRAGGAGIGRFPLSREWGGGREWGGRGEWGRGMGSIFIFTPFPPSPHSRESGNLPVFEAKPRRFYFDRQSAKARPRFRIILKYRSAPGGMSAPSGSNSPSLMSRPPINARI